MTADDPTVSDPQLYRVVWENDAVRVLEYRYAPGDQTHPHDHPNSVMVTLTSFRRRLTSGEHTADVTLTEGQAVWLDAQTHSGKNIGTTPTHTILVELKNTTTRTPGASPLGPSL